MPTLKAEQLEQIAQRIFQAAGVSEAEALTVARHLVEANLAGHDSHGVLRIPQYVCALQTGKVKPGREPKLISETACLAVLDGLNAFGQVIAQQAMALAISKARQTGVGAVTIYNSYHSGRIASYTLSAAAQGLIGIAMVNAGGGGQSVAPFGGMIRRLATNPISIAAPTGNSHPIVLDIATSVAPEGKIRDYLQKGKPLPAGWIIDSEGNPSNNPRDFYASPGGALLPLGGSAGYKGFGLAFMIDILAGALSGAGCCRSDAQEPKDGLLLLALDIEKFVSPQLFYTQVQALIEHVKSCPVVPGFDQVYIPGEIEILEANRRRQDGIPIDERTWSDILQVARDLGLEAVFKAWPNEALAGTAASAVAL